MDTQALQDTLSLACEIASLVDKLTKGFSFSEIGDGLAVLRDTPKVVGEFATALSEYTALDDAGRQALDAFIVQNFQLQEAGVQDIGQKVLEFAIQLSVILGLFHKQPAAS